MPKIDKMPLTTPQIQHWLATAERTLSPAEINASTPSLAMQFIARFGLRNAEQVTQFLHSAGGKIVEALLHKEAQISEQLNEYTRQQLLSEQQAHERSLAFLLMGLLYEREARAEELNERIMNDILAHNQKAEETRKEDMKRSQKKPVPIEELTKQLAAYQEAEEAIKHLLDKKYTEATAVEDELAHIEELLQEITTQYQQHEQYEQSIEQLFSGFETLKEELADDAEKIISTVESQIKTLSDELIEGAQRIGLAMENEQAAHHPAMIEPQHARNLHVSALEEILSVLTGRAELYTAEGERTHHFEEATFVLRKDKKLVRDNGVCYLLDNDQALNDLTPEAKTACRKPEHELFGIRQRISYQKSQYEVKRTETNEKKSRALLQSEALQQDIFLLTNQLTKVQAASATIRIAIREASPAKEQPPLKLTPPMPTPGAKSTPIASRYAAQSYHHILKLMKDRPTKQAIQGLSEYVMNAGLSAKDRLALQGSINRIVPGRPISPGLMRLLLSRENAMGSPLRHKDLSSGLDNYEPQPTSPSPFSMTPFGKKP